MNPNHDLRSAGIGPPHLSDEAVVQVHDFIYFCLDMFEAHYGDQIHRYYEDRSREAMQSQQPPATPDWGEPPF